MMTRTASRLFTASCTRLLGAAVVAATMAASCDAELVVGVLGRGPHDGSGGSGGGYATGSGGQVAPSGGNGGSGGSVASGGVSGTGSGGSGGAVFGVPVPNIGNCSPLVPALDATSRCGRAAGVAFSPDGQILAAGQESATPNVHLWSLPGGERLRDITGAGTVTYSVAFSPDGHLLATAGSPGSGWLTEVTPGIVNLWDVATGALVRNIPATCGLYADSVAFSPDGELLATAGAIGPIELWRVATGTLVASIPYPTTVHNVHFSPDGSHLIAAGIDGRATSWTVPGAALVFTLTGIADEMADAAYSPDGLTVASTGTGDVVKIWDVGTQGLRQNLSGHNYYVSHVLWIDDDHLVSDDWSGRVILWQKTGGTFGVAKAWQLDTQALGIAVSPDKSRLVVGGDAGISFLAL